MLSKYWLVKWTELVKLFLSKNKKIIKKNKIKKMCGNFYSKIFNRNHKRELIKIAIIDNKAILAKYLHLKGMKI